MDNQQELTPSSEGAQLRPKTPLQSESGKPQEPDQQLGTLELSERGETAFLRHVTAKQALNNAVKSDITILKETIFPTPQPQESVTPTEETQVNLSEILHRIEKATREQSEQIEQPLNAARHTLATTNTFVTEINVGMQAIQRRITDVTSQITPIEQQLTQKQEELRTYNQKNIAARALGFRVRGELRTQIQTLEKQRDQLQDQRNQLEAQITKAEEALQTMGQTRETAVITVAEEIITDITKRYDEFRNALSEDPEVKAELNERFIKTTLLPALVEIRENHDIPQDKVDGYIELIRGQLNEGTTFRDDDPPEKIERISKRNQQVQEVYNQHDYGYSLSDLQYRLGLYAPSSAFQQGNEGYNQIMDLLVRNEEYELLHSLMGEIGEVNLDPKIKQAVTDIISSPIAPKKEERGDWWGGYREPSKPDTLDIQQIDEEAFSKHFMGQVALQRWSTVRDYLGTTELFGASGFEHLERRVQEKTINALLTTPEHTDKAVGLGYRLLLFKNAEAAPFVIMNCWREPGYSGECPFLSVHHASSDTEAYKYIASLPDGEIEKLRQMNIPGVLEIINAVRQNPNTFNHSEVDSPDFTRFTEAYGKMFGLSRYEAESEIERYRNEWWIKEKLNEVTQETGIDVGIMDRDRRRVPNPTNQIVEQGLAKLCMHLIAEGDENKQFFVMGVLKRVEGDLGKEGYELLGNLLRDTKNPTLQAEMLEMVLRRYEDTNAATAVIKGYPNLAPELQEKVKKIGPELLRRFLDREEILQDPDTLQPFSIVLGKDLEEIKQTINFIRGLKSALPYGMTAYDDEKLDSYIELAKQPEILPFIQELAPFGYQFTIKHVHVLPEMVKHREAILAAIKELQSISLDFRYDLPYEFKYDPSTRESEQIFIADPHEIFVRQFSGRSFEDIFNKLYSLQEKQGTFSQEFSNGILRTLRWKDYLLKLEVRENIDESTYKSFHEAVQRLISETSSDKGSLRNFRDFYFNQNILQFLARRPESTEIVFGFPENGRLLMRKDMTDSLNFIFRNEGLLLQDVSDLKFLNRFVDLFGPDVDYFITQYFEGLQKGEITKDNREQFIEKYKAFALTHTTFSLDRLTKFQAAAETPFGRALIDLIPEEVERNKILFDYACFTERLETNKVNLAIQRIREGVGGEDLRHTFEYLRWLPETEITPQDTLDSLKTKYLASQERLKAGFNKIFPNAQEILGSPQNFENLNKRLNEICERFRFETRTVTLGGVKINLPKDFIREFNALRKKNPDVQFIPELAAHLINQASRLSTAYTIEDLMFSQIGETEDQTGRRRGRYTAEQLLQVMENNIEASLFTWSTAIAYQRERPDSPLFIIANERTGPADLAAEYLPQKFADHFRVSQSVDFDKFFEWFRQNEALVEGLYERHRQGEDVRSAIPTEVLSLLGIDSRVIIPIYRLKVPSSLNAASDEPEGINTVLNFLKFTSVLGGRALFMDESTRSAPRSIECLYNVLNRRQESLGGARIRLFGKINGVQGQNGTTLQEVTPETSQIEIGFIDPWHSQLKSVTDDSVGFVPEVQGKGVVEVVRPSYTSVSPYGISTVQDFWKQLIANEVSLRFEGFEESGRAKKRKEEFKPTLNESEEILTQEDLQKMAFERPYKALVLDLDGTVGSRGQYNPRVIEKIKELAGGEVDVVIGTSRSLIDHSEYDGSVHSFVEQLGELTDAQKSHIHLATENGAVISSLDNLDSPHEQHLLSDELANTVGSILTTLPPTVKMYGERGTLVLRGFDQDGKQEFMDSLRREIERLGLPLKVGSDSKHSIHIRVAEASKRNILNWLESRGININDIAKIGDSPEGNDRPMFWGRGSFNVGDSRTGTLWTIHQSEHGGGATETEELLKKLAFTS